MEQASADPSDVQERFEAAVHFIQSLPPAGAASPVALSNEDKLRLYALYKQATHGRNTTPAPGFFDMVGKYKWEAWRGLGDMEKTAAMQAYVEELLAKAAAMPASRQRDDFVERVTPKKRPPAPEQPGSM